MSAASQAAVKRWISGNSHILTVMRPIPKKASTIVAILVKLLLFIVALPFFFAMIALCFTSGVLMFMAMEGVILPGIWLLVIGGIVMCAAVIGALMHVVKGV